MNNMGPKPNNTHSISDLDPAEVLRELQGAVPDDAASALALDPFSLPARDISLEEAQNTLENDRFIAMAGGRELFLEFDTDLSTVSFKHFDAVNGSGLGQSILNRMRQRKSE